MNEWLKNNLLGVLGLGAIVTGAMKYEELRNLVFPDKETAVRTIDHAANAKTERQMNEVIFTFDTIAKVTLKDAVENFKRDSIRDAEVRKNSITIFQMKESQEAIEKIVKEMSKEQKHFIEDAHRNNN